MVAVERVIAFRDLPSEASLVNEFDNTISDWPSKGEIDVHSLSVRYRAGLPLSLKGLTFHIQGGSRVGVVGRTGGGKSTLVQSLLRLLEAEEGYISIDGVVRRWSCLLFLQCQHLMTYQMKSLSSIHLTEHIPVGFT
jgi:ATP-binding cassette subfamily C (CFTR/MRP) protein 4